MSMAPTSHGRNGQPGRESLGNGAFNNGPPPSTLAAQLVENISASTRSSRPDETAELKKLFGVIEEVKNNPETLESHQDRIEHNHMLIYVFARVVLEGLKWDDPFADREHLHSEALRAINFLKVTVRETPEVLVFSSSDASFMFRGSEPLWLWILPRVLKMLGHSQCLNLTTAIESLFQDFFIVIGQNGFLWPVASKLDQYMRNNFDALLGHLRESRVSRSGKDIPLRLRLPSDAYLKSLAATDLERLQQQCTYKVLTWSHALRHICSLVSILSAPLGLEKPGLGIAPTTKPIPWLLDAYSRLQNHQDWWRGNSSSCLPLILQSTLRVATMLEDAAFVDNSLKYKAFALLISMSVGLSKQFEYLMDWELDRDKASHLLCTVILKISEECLSNKPVARLVASQLIPALETISMQGAIFMEGTDSMRSLELLRHVVSTTKPATLTEDLQPQNFEDKQLRRQLQSLSLGSSDPPTADRPTKRRKVTSEPQIQSHIQKELYRLLGCQPNDDTSNLEQLVLGAFPRLQDTDRVSLIHLLGYMCCAADNTLQPSSTPGHCPSELTCLFCQTSAGEKRVPQSCDKGVKATVLSVFNSLVALPSFNQSREPRVTAMVALRRLAKHSDEAFFLDADTSASVLWCLKSLNSSSRELRIATGRTLPALLAGDSLPEAQRHVAQKTLGPAITVLCQISDPHLTETCMMAWSQLGRVVSDDNLGLVLHKLVEYLGSAGTITSASAFNEIISLARFKRASTRQLFEPYWKSLAYSALKELASQPRTASLLADMLEMNVAQFVMITQKYALPYLVSAGKRDVIQKIADLRKESHSWQPCLDVDNVGPILAFLLVRDTENIPENAMNSLREISSHFDELAFTDLLKIEPVMTSLELLKAAGDADEPRKTHIRSAFTLMASLIQGDTRQKKAATGRFLAQNALGMMARLTDIFNEPMNSRSTTFRIDEQKRCIKAMEEMIRIGKTFINIARPQISACVLSAIGQDELRACSFSCWSAMIFSLDEGDVEDLIQTTFFIINHYWNFFDEPTRLGCKGLIKFLLDKYSHVLSANISKLPSFSHISDLSDAEGRLSALRKPVDSRTAFKLLAERVQHENSGVVLQALRELTSYLQRQQDYIQASAVSEQPDTVIASLTRALLDCASRYAGEQNEISQLCTQSIGLVGCLDPNRVETVREERHLVVLSNFDDHSETTEFVLRLLEDVLVKSFLAATDTKQQGLLSYAMQELLERCDIASAIRLAKGNSTRDAERIYRRFLSLSDQTREVIVPFMNSRYRLGPMAQQQVDYPIFRQGRPYATWMRNFALDLLRRPQNVFSGLIFEPLCHVIRIKDLSTAEFLFPYLVLHVIISKEDTREVCDNVLRELLMVLQHEVQDNASYIEREEKKLYYEAIFRVLDYAMRWLQSMRSKPSQNADEVAAMQRVQIILDSIPAELISKRAVECKAYSRALFHLEQHIRQVEACAMGGGERERLLQRLQEIYTQIDEPDGLEGISAHLKVLDINQQILSHRKAGRWAEAQTWYEIKLAENPENIDIQIDLLTCLKESGQHDVLLNYVEGIEKHTAITTINRIVPYAVEASWATGRWQTMQRFMSRYEGDWTENFNVCIARTLLHLQAGRTKEFIEDLRTLRDRVGSSMTFTATSSLHAFHEVMLKCHVLTDLELIAGVNNEEGQHPQDTLKTLNRRLEVLGSYVADKQYVLGIRRAAMELKRPRFSDLDISALWLSSAKLARKANSMHQSFNAVLHASQLGDNSATIENARLLWKQGHNRKAIQTLQGAISNNVFLNKSFVSEESFEKSVETQQNMLVARAHLLLAKWLDETGQTHASALRQQYQNVPKNYGTWEKGHYHLGRHYKKVLESEKTLKPDDQSDEFLTGETAKLVIENYIRSLNYGTKYLYQTLPRILTLWLELGAQLDKAPASKVSISRELHHRRKTQLQSLHSYLYKYIQRMPAYIFYTALPQIVARIAHPNNEVFMLLESIIIKVVEAHPKQSLWSLFAILTSKQANSERRARGQQIVQKLRGTSKKVEGGSYDLKTLLRMGEKLADQLLLACNNGDFQSNRTTHASITRDLNFNHKCTPCPLVVPIETCLTATLPTLTDNVKKHKAFSRDVITIDSFLDDVLVLGSLAKPRKLTARGSNGKSYGLLIKPKDDLRTDQRLMEFNSMINRSLKRDAESSRRQLYIRTYAVTPLNEECGIIEWVDGLKTLRDILLVIYRSRGVGPNYNQLAQQMKDAVTGDKNIRIFTEQVLGQFPPVLPHWFISQFPNPSAWFAARLKYTRSCAVMSMVGTILGLGDRHGENVLLEEGNGGIFHVDFNCLFDKGLTFAQPERVPFRLTHNMVAAMGVYGYEGPFRQCSELTLSILRQQEETLMTILEAFIYDPTLDLQRDKKRKNEVVKLNPTSVVESIRRKVRGLLPEESIPLGVEGQVEELIKQAVNPRNLSAMYIGWCPFL
ncbi:Protein kinase rad3 [Apiospora marii]|uniref:Serine/threonine-protein kinase MEC1 n=1 Tax=Apiospora marii TaxID=335849 RepID=A0ABR1RFU8_9PEZI